MKTEEKRPVKTIAVVHVVVCDVCGNTVETEDLFNERMTGKLQGWATVTSYGRALDADVCSNCQDSSVEDVFRAVQARVASYGEA